MDDYVRSEAVLKESRLHHELNLDGECFSAHLHLLLSVRHTILGFFVCSACTEVPVYSYAVYLTHIFTHNDESRSAVHATELPVQCHAVYLTQDSVIAATHDTMEDTIKYLLDKYGTAANYLHEVRFCRSAHLVKKYMRNILNCFCGGPPCNLQLFWTWTSTEVLGPADAGQSRVAAAAQGLVLEHEGPEHVL